MNNINSNNTIALLKIIGSPYANDIFLDSGYHYNLEELYKYAFSNRVELLFLKALDDHGMLKGFEKKKEEMELRCTVTRKIAANTSKILYDAHIDHVVFKSIKPYPATPNDTDICCLGGHDEYDRGISVLKSNGYEIQNSAPMQTLCYHPWGKGKVGPGKEGGTYYIDWYKGVAVDYYEYINKNALKGMKKISDVEGVSTVLLRPEPELAIVMFHNVFPEKTFQLEHFYLCLFNFANEKFDFDIFIDFIEKNCMVLAVKCNLTIIEILHRQAFGFVPDQVESLLNRWGRVDSTQKRLESTDYAMEYMFSAKLFWSVFIQKLQDPFCRLSLIKQCVHMLNPIFFWDAFTSACTRTFGKDIYTHK